MSQFRMSWMAASLLAVCLPALAREPGVSDRGEFFSADAVHEADQTLARIKRDFGKELVVETFPSIPEQLRGKETSEGKESFYRDWARSEARKIGLNGIILLVTR